jgi:hypothetical protein
LIFQKAIGIAAGLAALAAAAGVCVVALAFTLYAAVLPAAGPAWASAIVAAAAAVLVALGAAIALLIANPPRRKGEEPKDLSLRALDLAREKPVVAAIAIVAAGVVALRNPKITAALVGAFMAGRAPKK